MKFIIRMKQINSLEVYSINLLDKHLIDIVKNLPNLTKIGINNEGITMAGIMAMLQHANQLSTLRLQYGGIIVEANFIKIVQIIKNRNNGIILNIILDGCWYKLLTVNRNS